MTGLVLTVVHHDLAAARAEAPPGDAPFADVLVGAATLVLGACALWFWLVTTAAALEALRGAPAIDVAGVRGAVRRLVLAGCGVAVVAGVAPAHAEEIHGAAGQPPQPLVVTVAAAPAVSDAVGPVSADVVVVRPGDSLWSLAETRLAAAGGSPDDAVVDRAWRELWRANASTIGKDPDRVLPGQRLDVPESLR